MTLDHLLKNVRTLDIDGSTAVGIGAIRFDSRQLQPGDVFVAVRGTQADGHAFIENALQAGVAAVVCETYDLPRPVKATVVRVGNTAEALGIMAANYYDRPSHALKLVGVTGTNGKTTVVTLLWQLFSKLGYKCGMIGTIEHRIGDELRASTHTTPDPLQLHALMREMVDSGCTHVFMEVSSHAVHQRRIAGLHFAGAVFTNLSHDHLDYHKTFAAYRDAKKMFFDDLPGDAFALSNADDRNGAVMLQNTRAAGHFYGLKTPADFKTRLLENSLDGLYLEIDGTELHARLIGEFNAYNLTATYAAARLLGVEKMEALTMLSDLRGAEGRFDYLKHPAKAACIGIVDYAHTPDALEKVLETIQKLRARNAKVITVTGAGGDRDKTKRPQMAQVSARFSDQVILTSDNPRSEDPAAILRDMESGLDEEGLKKTLVIQDREQAIKTAVRLAGDHDVILIAGKGHEKYQEIKGVRYPFDDKETLKKFFYEYANSA